MNNTFSSLRSVSGQLKSAVSFVWSVREPLRQGAFHSDMAHLRDKQHWKSTPCTAMALVIKFMLNAMDVIMFVRYRQASAYLVKGH